MRKNLILSLLILSISTATFATVRTVSNNSNSPGQYTSMSAAITAAIAGDTLMVHGSNNDYGSFTISKQLTIIGTGHNPQKQGPLVSFTNGTITFGTGSSNSKLIGFRVNTITQNSSSIIGVQILLCQITSQIMFGGSSTNNWVIDGNVFTGTSYNINGSSGHTWSNWQIRNNIFNGQIYYSTGSPGHYFNNNIFLYNGAVLSSLSNSFFNNNIFYRATVSAGSGNQYNNNLFAPVTNTSSVNSAPISQNNINAVASSAVFVTDLGTGANFSYTTDYNLVSGSPGKNSGTDGTDRGVYGGDGDYDQNGVPTNPYISEFGISNPSISNGGTLNINFKSKIR